MIQIFVYIASRQSILMADYLRKKGHYVTTITANPSLFESLERKGYSAQYLSCDTGVARSLRGLHRQKIAIKSIMATKEIGAVLVLTHNAYDILGWYLARKWAESTGSKSVWFQEMDPARQESTVFEVIRNIRVLIKYIYAVFFLGVPFITVLQSRKLVLGVVKNAQLSKICVFDPFGESNFLRKIIYKESRKPVSGVLFLGFYPEIGFLEQFKRECVLSVLEAASKKLFFKPHPRSDEEIPNSRWTRLPNDELAEYFIGPETIVVGIASAAMIFSSRDIDALTVSLSRLILGEGKRNAYWLDFLNREGVREKIIMPENVEELSEYLAVSGKRGSKRQT